MPAVLKTHFCTFKAITDTHCFLPQLLVTKGRYEQQCLPEDLCTQPALALLIHLDFAKQTFNFTSICQMSLQFSSQHVSCYNAEDLFLHWWHLSPKISSSCCHLPQSENNPTHWGTCCHWFIYSKNKWWGIRLGAVNGHFKDCESVTACDCESYFKPPRHNTSLHLLTA